MATLCVYRGSRPAIAMIELIFAIVIMGFALMSAPMMIANATKSSNVAFEQESIAIAAAHTASLMSYAWDERNSDGWAQDNILCTDSTTTGLVCNNSTDATRLRKIANSPAYNTKASSSSSFSTADALPPGGGVGTESSWDDVDDFDQNITTLTVADATPSVTNEGDYMDQSVSILTDIAYIADAPSNPTFATCNSTNGCAYSNPATAAIGTSTSVKQITTTLTSTNLPDKQIALNAFMCNIGAPQPQTNAVGY